MIIPPKMDLFRLNRHKWVKTLPHVKSHFYYEYYCILSYHEFFNMNSQNKDDLPNLKSAYWWTWIWRTTVQQIFAYDGRYAWSQSDAYQVFVICIRQIFECDRPIFLVPLSMSYPSSPVLWCLNFPLDRVLALLAQSQGCENCHRSKKVYKYSTYLFMDFRQSVLGSCSIHTRSDGFTKTTLHLLTLNPFMPVAAKTAWQSCWHLSCKAICRKIFEGEMLGRKLLSTLLQKFFNLMHNSEVRPKKKDVRFLLPYLP